MKKINKILNLGLAFGLTMVSLSALADLNDQVEAALNNNGAKAQIETSLKDISKNMAAIFAHRSLAPAETLGGGIGGFEVGLNLAMVDLDTQPLTDLVAQGEGTLESQYDIASIPILDKSHKIVGVVEAEDIIEKYEEAGDIALEQAAVTSLGKPYLESSV